MATKRTSLKEKAFEKLGLGQRQRSNTDMAETSSTDGQKKGQGSGSSTVWYTVPVMGDGGPRANFSGSLLLPTGEVKVESSLGKMNNSKDMKPGVYTPSDVKAKKSKPENTVEYTVADRDTLASVAAFWDTTPSELKKLNKMTSTYIFPGQVLYVPDGSAVKKKNGSQSESEETETKGKSLSPTTSEGKNSPVVVEKSVFDMPVVKMSDPKPAVVPGHVVRQIPSPEEEFPHRLTEEEARQLDQDCYERFIKVNVKHITDGMGVVSGVLLVTPNAVMFDPNVSDPLVIEHGAEVYGVIAPMDMIASAALYHDIAAMNMRLDNKSQESAHKPEVYHDKSCPLYDLWVEGHTQNNTNSKNNVKVSPVKQSDISHSFSGDMSGSESACSCGASDGVFKSEPTTPDNSLDKGTDQDAGLKTDTLALGSVNGKQTDKGGGEKDSDVSEARKETGHNKADADAINVDSSASDVCKSDSTAEFSEFISAESCDAPTTSDSKDTCSSPSKLGADASLGGSNLKEVKVTPKAEGGSKVSPKVSPHGGAIEQIGNIVYLPLAENEQGQVTMEEAESTHSAANRLSLSNFEELDGQSRKSEEKSLKGARSQSESSPIAIENMTDSSAAESKSSGSLGSFNVTQSLSEFVNYATGLFKSNPDVKDINEVLDVKESSLARERTSSVGSGKHKKPTFTLYQPQPAVSVENAITLADKPELFQSFDKLIPRPAATFDDMPFYLCLKLGKPINKEISKTCPIEAYRNRKKKPEYWFSVPREKVDQLYAFFVQWTPDIYGDEDITSRGFVVLNDETESEEENLEISDEHFSVLHKDWEIVSANEAERRKSVAEPEIFPELLDPSSILQEEHITMLNRNLPARTIGYAWTLIYSSDRDGFSLKTLYREMQGIDSPILLVVKDTNDYVFGALTSCALQVSDHFYGTGESFLYTFYPEFKLFRWVGENNFFIKGNPESVSIGSGQGKFGLWFDGDLYHGRTNNCETYDNDILTSSEDFVVKTLEAWAFID